MNQNSINFLRRVCRGRAVVYSIFAVFFGVMAPGIILMGFFWSGVAMAGGAVFFIYHLLKALWLRGRVMNLPCKTADGYALVSEEIYHHTLPIGDVTRVTGKRQTLNRTVDIGGIEYLLPTQLAEPPEAQVIRIFYVTLKMFLFSGKFSRLIIDYQVLNSTEALAAEQALNMGGLAEASENLLGKLSATQIKELYIAKIKFAGLINSIFLPIGVGLLYGFSVWAHQGLSWQAWCLGVVGLVAVCIPAWIIISAFNYLRAIPKKNVHQFNGVLKKMANPSGGRVSAGGYYLLHNETRYECFPDSLFQKIPQSLSATYFWFDDDGTKMIINYVA